MPTREEWIKKLQYNGARVFKATSTPEFNKVKELLAADFRVIDDPQEGKRLKTIRDRFAKDLRKDGWTVIVEPKAQFFTDKGIGEGYSFSAVRIKK